MAEIDPTLIKGANYTNPAPSEIPKSPPLKQWSPPQLRPVLQVEQTGLGGNTGTDSTLGAS